MATAVIGLALAACAGSSPVVTVNGETFRLDDIPIATDASTVDLDVFRNAINWVIANKVVVSAAEEEFGISIPRDEVMEAASALLAGGDARDPRSNLDFLLIQAQIGPNGLLWPELQPRLPEGITFIQWANDRLREADVEVGPKYGEWQAGPQPGVYSP